jgi:hypothetical protein
VCGALAGVGVAVGVRLPLVVLPLVDAVTFAQDNRTRAMTLVVCGLVAAVCSLARWFRLALLCQGIVAGLMLSSTLEKMRDYQQLQESAHAPAGSGEMARQYADMTAKTLTSIHPQIGAFLLPGACVLGIVAALAGSLRVKRRRQDAECRATGPVAGKNAPPT